MVADPLADERPVQHVLVVEEGVSGLAAGHLASLGLVRLLPNFAVSQTSIDQGVPFDEMNGLRAVFGEQYPDPVRVVAVGGPGIQAMMDDPEKAEWAEMAIEFCGGTHIATSSEAGEFALLSEEGLDVLSAESDGACALHEAAYWGTGRYHSSAEQHAAAGALAEAAYLGDTLEPSDSEDEMEAESDLDNGDEEITDLVSDGEDA